MKRAITLKLPKTASHKRSDPDNPPWSEEMLGATTLKRGRGLQKAPTRKQDAKIFAAAKSDPDAQPLTVAQLAAMVPLRSLRGRSN